MRLKTYLTEKKIAIPDFAEKIGVTVQAAHRYARGERIPRREVMDQIAKFTGGKVQPNDLVDANREVAAANEEAA